MARNPRIPGSHRNRDGSARIDDFDIDDANIEHLHRHGVSVSEVRQALESEYTVQRNAGRDNRAQAYVLLGCTHGGRWLAIPMAPAARPGVWRPATAFDLPPRWRVT